MDNGMNSIQSERVIVKNKVKKRIGCLLWITIFGAAYVLLTLWAQWTPPVKGIVVDVETGQPIEGVEIIRQGQGGTIAPTEKEYSWISCPNHTTTGKDGTFNIPGTFKSGFGGDVQFTPTVWINEIGLYADHTEYVCSKSPYGKTHPAIVDAKKPYKPTTNGWEEGRSPYGYAFYERRKLWFFRGYEYRIRLKRAETEEEWRAKCECALNVNFKFMQSEPAANWVFNDLVGYLERFPNGEKAGDIALILLDRLAIGDSRTNIDEELSSGELDSKKMELIMERNQKIIQVVSKVTPPSHPGVVVMFSDYEQRLESIKNCTLYLKEKLNKGDGK